MNRIDQRFADLGRQNRAAFVAYVMAGDPDPETAWRILEGLPAAGADLIELGLPFSDPMADGPPIQRAALRALRAGMTTQLVPGDHFSLLSGGGLRRLALRIAEDVLSSGAPPAPGPGDAGTAPQLSLAGRP